MRNLLGAIVVVLLVVSAYGAIMSGRKDRLRLTKYEDRSVLHLVVTVPDASESYAWLQIIGCSADVSDNGVSCNPAAWFSSSTREIDARRQHVVPFRDAPKGTLHFTAFIADRFGNHLANGSYTFMRGF